MPKDEPTKDELLHAAMIKQWLIFNKPSVVVKEDQKIPHFTQYKKSAT